MLTLRTFMPTLIVVVAALLLYMGINFAVTSESREILVSETPELRWLQKEYQLSDEQFIQIKEIHEAHDAECLALCHQLATTQNALRDAVRINQSDNPELQSLLKEWREHRKISQDSILKHMFEVSSLMSAEQGRRYRDNVYRMLILPGRAPHIDNDGEFQPTIIDRLHP